MTDKQWDNIVALHNTAPFKLVREAAPYFRVTDGENRCIINISSTSGVHGNAGQANYGLAKSGINGLTKVIAKEWGRHSIKEAGYRDGSCEQYFGCCESVIQLHNRAGYYGYWWEEYVGFHVQIRWNYQ